MGPAEVGQGQDGTGYLGGSLAACVFSPLSWQGPSQRQDEPQCPPPPPWCAPTQPQPGLLVGSFLTEAMGWEAMVRLGRPPVGDGEPEPGEPGREVCGRGCYSYGPLESWGSGGRGKFGGTGEMVKLHISRVHFQELPEGRIRKAVGSGDFPPSPGVHHSGPVLTQQMGCLCLTLCPSVFPPPEAAPPLRH